MDLALYEWLHGLAGRSASFDTLAVDCTKYAAAMLGVLVLGAWVLLRADRMVMPRRLALVAIVAALLALGASQVIGHTWFRERPYVAHPAHLSRLLVPPSPDPSFPSDHATGAFALAVPFVLDRRTRRFGTLLLVIAAALGVSRVIVGTHYPSDVLGGALLGSAAAVLVMAVASWLDRAWPAMWAPVLVASTITDRVVAVAWRARALDRPAQ